MVAAALQVMVPVPRRLTVCTLIPSGHRLTFGICSAQSTQLLALLDGLIDEDWHRPTACPSWTVHELVVHLVHDDLRRLSGQRDGHKGVWVAAENLEQLTGAIDDLNNRWVATVAPSLSPRLARDLLHFLAAPSEAHLTSLDPMAEGMTVGWAGPGPHPNWLDVAREFTERWVHQQQLRDAVARPGLDSADYLEPVIDTFARVLPMALPSRKAGTQVELRVRDPFQRSWTCQASSTGWTFTDPSNSPDASVEVPAAALWRRAVRMSSRQDIARQARVHGDPQITDAILDLRAAIVADNPHPEDETPLGAAERQSAPGGICAGIG
jgi:uncharacterized protein (TIGR03083 family)